MYNEIWDVILEGIVELGGLHGWVLRADLDDHLSLTLDSREISKGIYSLVKMASIVDDGGYGQKRHFMVTQKGLELIEQS